MAGIVAFDTTFLIDLQRERAQARADGPAHRLLAEDPDRELHLSATAQGEFSERFDRLLACAYATPRGLRLQPTEALRES